MAYISPTPQSTGHFVTAAEWNQDVVENQIWMRIFAGRQGGDAVNWYTGGTNNYSQEVNFEVGSVNLYMEASASGTVVVTFPAAFSAPPLVFLQMTTDTAIAIKPEPATATQVTIDGDNPYGVPMWVTVFWLAIGPA